MTQALIATLTTAGLAKLFAAHATGLSCNISHIALGSGLGGAGYSPSPDQTALKGEFIRAPVGGGERTSASTILVQAVFTPTASGWAHEVGVFLTDGTLFALYSTPRLAEPITYVQAGEVLVQAITLGVAALPADVVSWVASGASVNITLAAPFVDLTTAIFGLQARVLAAEVARVMPAITNIYGVG